MASFVSMILRFRDLSTPAGTTTIEEHQRKIAEKNFVWWGWWHKQGESVPEGAFREILDQIKKGGPYEVFLFDTGKNELRRASLTDIHWDSKLEKVHSPDRDATPDYYGDVDYLAWFKLTVIEEAVLPETKMREWSYVRVDELFETRKSVFESFYGKQLSSFFELRSQDRTIWFVRQKRDDDAVHEIHVYDRSKTTPSNFPKEPVRLHSPNFLWVSDPHFSTEHHAFPRDPQTSRTNLSETIRKDLEHLGITSVGGLLITGDLTWKGAREEYDWAAKFIRDIQSWARLTASQILVCPGNHDLAFSSEPWVKGAAVAETGEASVAEYKRFYEQLYEVKAADHMACGRRFWIPDGHIVDVVSLNSSVLQQIPDAFQGQGLVGQKQLADTADEMRWTRRSDRLRAYRICMLHHHVVPILHTETPKVGVAASVVYDAGAFMRWLVENEVDLVLHGHMHLPTLVKEKRALDFPKLQKWHEIAIAALGSSGVKSDHRPNQPNSYGLIEFLRSGVKLTVRYISADDSIHHDQRNVYSATLNQKHD